MAAMEGSDNLAVTVVQILRHHKRRYEEEDRLEVLFSCHGRFFDVMLSDKPLSGFDTTSMIEQQYIKRFDACSEWDGGIDDEPPDFETQNEELLQEMEGLLKNLLQPELQKLGPDVQDYGVKGQNLQAYITPDVFNFQLATLAGEPKLVRRDEVKSPIFHPPIPDPSIISAKIQVVEAQSIRLIKKLAYSWVLQVSVDGQPMVCKLTSRSGHDSLPREYTILQQILDSGAASSIRVPTLRGVIKSHDGGIVGILLEYLKPSIPNLEIGLLNDRTISRPTREKWVNQINETVEQLHNMDVVWGDAKTSNVLIDEHGDAWILDFGGGNTVGWIPEELVGTKKGDLQALKMIFEFIRA